MITMLNPFLTLAIIMLIKVALLILLLVIILSLASGLVFLVKDGGKSKRTVKALSWRIGLSLAAFVLIIIGAFSGQIKLHGITPTQVQQPSSE